MLLVVFHARYGCLVLTQAKPPVMTVAQQKATR
jgi:hypothetical protein